MDKATEGHMKELCRVIKYALDMQTIGLKLKPEDNNNKLWELKAYSDADFAGDKETRIIVTGYVVYFVSVPVCWCSCGQKSVTLSRTEAEYVACTEVVKEVLFIIQLLKHLRVEVQFVYMSITSGQYFWQKTKEAVIGQSMWIQDIILYDNI